jgi:maltose alpha-D-glucosyltransferase/alpha-amylase
MLRSFDYAAHSALTQTEDNSGALVEWAGRWRDGVSDLFLEGWREAAKRSAFIPAEQQQFKTLLDAFLLEKVIYEVGYELNNRPTWLPIPARGLLRILREPS